MPPEAGDSTRSDPLIGTRLGAYRVEHVLGHGGMGTVYLGVRADEAFRKRVAIKVLKPGMDSEEILRRFREERQILAGLDHPHIARLLDGGATEDGRPYLVLEHVQGRTLDRYCEEEGLTVRERIELFRKICSAVQFAHRNLVVHRDLKPGNVLVTSDGTPKLLDFGIAKLLNPDLTARRTLAVSGSGRLMTPGYASPEQLRGDPVSTATDVYSLGVMLYELLTDRLPFGEDGGAPWELLRKMEEDEPPSPSRVAPKPRRSRLKGDLDDVARKALSPRPRHRYESVEQLSEDLRRHLEGLPIQARPQTLTYRAGKFVRRHRVAVAAVAAFVVACLGFGILMGLQRQEIARERDRAELERERAEQVTDFVVDLFEIADPAARGASITARELLDEGARQLSERLEDQPVLRAELVETIGEIYRNLGLYDAAQPRLEQALELRREALGPRDPTVADTLNELAVLYLALGDFAAMEQAARQALEIQLSALAEDAPAATESRANLAASLQSQGRLDEAEDLYAEVIPRYRQLAVEDPELMLDLAGVLHNDGALKLAREDFDSAEERLRESFELRRRRLAEDHPAVTGTMATLAVVARKQGRTEEAERLLRQVLKDYRERFGDDHPLTANVLFQLAVALSRDGHHGEALPHAQQAARILRPLFPATDYRLAKVEQILGECLTGLGRYGEAEPLLLGAHAALRAEYGDGHPDVDRAARALERLYDQWPGSR